jgi:hypothetical protein
VWAGCGVFWENLGGFAVAARQGFQGLRQLVQDLWVDDFSIQNPY